MRTKKLEFVRVQGTSIHQDLNVPHYKFAGGVLLYVIMCFPITAKNFGAGMK